MRSDGRLNDRLRPVTIHTGYLLHPDGSVLIQMGKTHVICTACFEEKVPGWLKGTGKGWITAEYGMLPGSTGSRKARDISKGRLDGRSQEIQRLIGRSLRAVADLEKLGECTLWIDCDVIQADGGTRTAAITGSYVAMMLAIEKRIKQGQLSQNPIRTALGAVSVGMVAGEPMLDLCYEEDSSADVDMNIVMTGDGKFIECQGTAEQEPFTREEMNRMLDLAEVGIRQLFEIQQQAMKGADGDA